MCFSMEASFTATGALLPVGAYCVRSAIRKSWHFLPLAFVPVAFAVQQAAEGFVWYGLRHADPRLVHWSVAVFLFFALAFWPFWTPFSLLFAERRRWARVVLGLTAAVSLSWLGYYIVMVLGPNRELHARVVHHSIDYGLANLRGFHDTPIILWQLPYLAFICGPLLLVRARSHETHWRVFAAIVTVLLVVSNVIYWYAYASVWCFFAAVSSLLLAITFAKLPRPAAENERKLK